MVYLQPAEYLQFGLDEETGGDVVVAASAMIDAFCRRPGLDVQTYTERLRFAPGLNIVRVSNFPLAVIAPAESAVVRVRVRIGRSRGSFCAGPLEQAVCTFGLAGTWSDVDVASVDVSPAGEISIPRHVLGAVYDEAEVTYTAGWSVVPDAVKAACAQVARNAQATPALNVKSSRMDAMQMEYFSGALLDDEAKRLLRPYVSTRLG